MSRRKTDKEYECSFASHFFRWLVGEKDMYIDHLEMKKTTAYQEPLSYVRDRLEVKTRLNEKLYSQARVPKIVNVAEGIYHVFSVVFCVLLVVLLVIAVSWLPPLGTVDRPVNNEVSERYLEKGLEETGAINLVSGMILDYRAFDTLGESHVLFTATVTVLILLQVGKGLSQKGEDNKKTAYMSAAEDEDEVYEPEGDDILKGSSFILVPAITIFGIYVILNGHLGPGGGFSGGALIGSALILHLNAFGYEKTERFFTEKTYKLMSFGALAFYCLAKSYSFFTGANHIESVIGKGTPGDILSSGLILPLNIAVGLVVACTMYAFYVMFRKGDF